MSKIPVSRSNSLPELCRDYLKASAKKLAAEKAAKTAKAAIFKVMGEHRLLKAGQYLIERKAVPTVEPKVITRAMVGDFVGGRVGYDLLEVKKLEAANDDVARAA